MEQQLTETTTNLPTAPGPIVTKPEDILSSDMIIPRILLQQGLSQLVSEQVCRQGDIVKSGTGYKLADPKKALDFIPITFRNMWKNEEMINGKYEFRGTEVRDASNEFQDWEYQIDGVQWRRTKTLEVFVLLPQDVAAFEKAKPATNVDEDFVPDLTTVVMPYVVTFQSTGFKTGKELLGHFAKARTMGVPAYKYVLSLGCELSKNDKGSFFVWKLGANITPAIKSHWKEAQKWHKVVASNANTFKVDDSEESFQRDEETIETDLDKSEF